ncbi:type IV pilus biogenesis/stability protein PilW [Persephonella hydrogeniphila]|uniref:Type IV pilus biogenesis/stability protein PilW n=1 Tax=Persephonella hydrogeniphila TaxID=198703 RepID=A0A285N204_9AQUI|nr:tetratricopeptide repeat protein [Persephonella hydrogeniphila]SNZ02817.1 type IV pilus biogenesis/stability protein PilW [Persephonella hydrogeniphila]
MKKIILLLTGIAVLIFTSCAPKVQKEEISQNARYYYKIGLSYLNSGNNSQALYYLNRAYQINPEDPEILNALGIAYSNVGEFEKAKKFFLKAIEKNPDKAETYTNLGALLAREKQYDKALWYFQKAAENPSYMKKDIAFYNIALIYKQKGNMKLYEENLKKAISYNAFLLPAYVSLGDYYLSQKKYEDALVVYLTAKDKGLVSPDIFFGLGKVYYYIGDYDKSKEYLLKAKKLAKNNDLLLIQINRFLKLVDKKIIEEAESKLEKEDKKQTEMVIPPVKTEKKEVKQIEKQITEKEEKKEEKQVEEKKEELKTEVAKKEAPKISKKVIRPKIRFYVLVGRFSDQKKAMEIVEKLKSKGFSPEIKEDFIDGTPVYSVIIGYFREYREASRFYRKNLKPLGLRGIVKFTRK